MRGFARAVDRLTIYLPVILMGLLALGTYWLARNTPTSGAAPVQEAPTHDPDYFLRGFSVKSFDPNGRLKTEIRGTEARHFPDNDTLEIDQPRMRSFSETGALTTGTADRALSNSDGSEVQLFGNAIVTRQSNDAKGNAQPKLEIRSDFLHIFGNTEKVRTNKPVVLTRGDDRFAGDSLDYDNLDRVLELHGRVHGVIQPQPASPGATAPAKAP
ncbi:LPS export ABC transporter periplasmic protein LptC [Ramlibacter sp. G-1-2-2]|uniref:LPS export ABC transporter periplasmic protein LptC n=1 Tax=Ramlibacter agri TaxID=2728837 RepID=A0A848GYS9_9BURK|nr:LPS export ABC transporter periplasmic protein LptC [Ramlibacter agri]NML42551.1 LPS export ABC transporter periplasmic protein LptC [Ramlibacter agri]